MAIQDFGSPILNLSWNSESSAIFAGCCDNYAKMWDLHSNRVINVGQHTKPIAQLHWSENLKMLYTMSWDNTISAWDGRQQIPIQTFVFDKKVSFITFIIISPIICP